MPGFLLPREALPNIRKLFRFQSEEQLEALERRIAHYVQLWDLTELELIPYYSVNLVLYCASSHGKAVLKLGEPAGEKITEAQTLRLYEGKGMCRLLGEDTAGGALLLERVQPGRTLWHIQDVRARAQAFCSLYSGLHIPCDQTGLFPSYVGWIDRIAVWVQENAPEQREMIGHILAARKIAHDIAGEYKRSCLLHGDLHQENILENESGGHTIIDPKGVLGDPVFDLGRYMLNENEAMNQPPNAAKMRLVMETLAEGLGLPLDLLGRLLYMETALAHCWWVESGAGPDEIPPMVEVCAFTRRLMEESST